MRKEKSNYYSNQLAEGKDSKEIWRTLHKIVPKKTKTVPPSGDGLTALCLNGFFKSIADTLSSHFDCSTLPKVLTPEVNHDFVLEEVSSSFIRKELLEMKSTKATGLDGISARLLKDAAPEVSESITYIINLTISTSTIPSETAAVNFVDHILEQMDRQMMTGSIFIDLRKAFDLVDHQCLLHKLAHYGIRDKSLKWFENYLTTRLQSVKYNQDISSNLAIGHGVPQGSILGPILFVIYINDLPQCLMKSAIGMYADDTVIYFSATSAGLIKQVLQNDLIYVEQWLQENKLVLNQSKTKWMLFGTRQKLEHSSDIEIQFHGQNIDRVSNFCYLGVTLDEHLSWNEHVEIICHKVSKRLGLLSRIRPYLTQKAAKCVYNCLIQPILNYTDTVWGLLSIGCGKNLQHLQNRAARIVQGRSTTDEAFQKLGWINLQTQRIMHKCILVYKCLYNLAPPYLCDYFLRNNCIHSHNTRNSNDLHLPAPKLSLGKTVLGIQARFFLINYLEH